MPFNRPIPESGDRPKSSPAVSSLVEAEKMLQIAILLPVAAGIGWLIGAWFDTHLHQSWIGMAGILFGGISGLVYVVRLVMSAGAKPGKGTSHNPTSPGPKNPDGQP